MLSLGKTFKRFKEYNALLGSTEEISRRFATTNTFDAILAMVGIVIGNMFAGIAESRFVIIGGLGASIAMAVSGIWGTYLSEKAERKKKLEELEKHMLTRLKKTKIGKASRLIPFVIAIIGGLIPFIASLIILFPLFVLPLSIAYLASVSIAFALLFGLGLYLGKLSKENVVIFGLKMVLAGLVAVLISFLLGVK